MLSNDQTQSTPQEKSLNSKKVLFILPHHDFRDKEYTLVKERIEPLGITSEVASTHLSEAQGRFGTLVQPDVLISFVEADDYDAYIFVGEEAASQFFDNDDIRRILSKAFSKNKVVAAIGEAVTLIAYSGHLTGKKVTSTDTERIKIEELGAFFTGRIVEQDGDIITASGPYATIEFAEAIIKALQWQTSSQSLGGRAYLR